MTSSGLVAYIKSEQDKMRLDIHLGFIVELRFLMQSPMGCMQFSFV